MSAARATQALAWLIPLAASLAAFVVLSGVLRAPAPTQLRPVALGGEAYPQDAQCRRSASCVAGYRWAAEHGINDEALCPAGGDFEQGCLTLLDEVDAQAEEEAALAGAIPTWWQQ